MTNKISSIIVILMTFLFHLIGFTQTDSKTTTIDSTVVKKPIAIPVIDIIGQLSEANSEIKNVAEKIDVKNEVTKIDSLLPGFVRFIKESKELEQNLITSNPNRQKIDNLLNQWIAQRVSLKSWQASVNNSEIRNEILRDQISDSEIIWKLTYENAEKEAIPLEILYSTKAIWKDYNRLNTTLNEDKNKFLNLENKINNQIVIIDAVIEELNNLKNSEVYSLFYLRHRPLWEETMQEDGYDTPETVGVESISENLLSTINYIKSLGTTGHFLLFIILTITIILFLVKNSFQKHPLGVQSKSLLRAKEIVENKIGWGILFLALVLSRMFFPNTPKIVFDLLLIFILISATALIRPYLRIAFKNIPYLFILILILDLAKTYIWLNAFEYRLYLLFETSLIFGILIYFTYTFKKSAKLKAIDSTLWRITPLIYVFVITAYISNILGYTNLTDLIIKLCIQGGDLTLIFYAIFLMLNTIILGVLNYHFNEGSKTYSLNEKTSLDLRLQRYIKIFTLFLWLFYFLNLFDLYHPLLDLILDIFSKPYKVGEITFTLGMIFMFVAILVSSYLITSIISFLLDGNEIKLFFIKLPKGVPAIISLVIRYLILAFGVVLALSVLGLDLSKFNLLAGALGLGIGFGLQTIVSNFISGVILIFERPILTGDVIEVNNLIGTVSKIGVRASHINTYEGAEVVVPNNNLISKDLINWTLSNNIKRVEVLLSVSHNSDPSEVLKVLEKVALKNEKVLKSPPPVAVFDKFGESTLKFRLLFWVDFKNGFQTKSDVSIAVFEKFKELGIKIPILQHEVHLLREDVKSQKRFDN